MIRLRQIKLGIEEEDKLLEKCAKKLNISINKIKDYKINKKSLDARKKSNLCYIYEVDILLDNEDKILSIYKSKDIFKTPNEEYFINVSGKKKLNYRPIIVGSGPCGLFCAYMLASLGYKPIIIERGDSIDTRIKKVEEFWSNGNLDKDSNVQFGEGGAGTFSDGKLNTLTKDKLYRQKKIFEIFLDCGAPKEILYINNPHIGTDILVTVLKNMRKKIEAMGGEFRFRNKLTDIKIDKNKIKEIEINNSEVIKTDILVLAIGHSARDTFKMLLDRKISIVPKPFAIGVRIQHPQDMINLKQYGKDYKEIGNASYKLTYKASNNRGVYTFCMCPGGYVVNSSSEDNHLVVNGMSNYKRDSGNANSAVIVTVTPDDFGYNPLDGVEFQRKLESLAYKECRGKIPIQLYKDFKENKLGSEYRKIKPIMKGAYSFGKINNILPKDIIKSLIEGIDYFDTKIKGFGRDDAIIAAVEARTSSPIRILRNEEFLCNIEGIYPAGEGAGYSGGITSSAVDGLKIAEQIAKIYINK